MNENGDFLENIEADLEDLRCGRIKDIEHLEAVDKLLDKCSNVVDSMNMVIETDSASLYGQRPFGTESLR